jgi:two-component system CheB/CheR fusion protein
MPLPGHDDRLDLRGVIVLVVEDHDDSRNVLCRIVESFGGTARGAESGEQALALALSEKPDLVFCDLLMPGMDGFEFIARVRSEPSLRKVRVIAVSCLGSDADFRNTWEAGFNGHLAKPVDFDIIAAQLARVFAGHLRPPPLH